jgi:hypothetical protein
MSNNTTMTVAEAQMNASLAKHPTYYVTEIKLTP